MPYQGKDGEIPYYAINNAENDALFLKYKELGRARFRTVYLLGRLAEYKYYNIDAMVDRSTDELAEGNLRKRGVKNETYCQSRYLAIIQQDYMETCSRNRCLQVATMWRLFMVDDGSIR